MSKLTEAQLCNMNRDEIIAYFKTRMDLTFNESLLLHYLSGEANNFGNSRTSKVLGQVSQNAAH